MSTATVGIVHPGAMGAAVGAMALAGGAQVFWASKDRSTATAERAQRAGLEELPDLQQLAKAADVLISVCPPHAAAQLAGEVAATGFAGTYVDANAVAPQTAERVGAVIGSQARFVDGGIIGGPPRAGGSTRLYLSGDAASEVAALFDNTALTAIVVDGPIGCASALKACYAAYTKGTTALLATIRALARHHGIEDALLAQWAISHPDLPDGSASDIRGSAPKGWRHVGEMEEIAAACHRADLPAGALEAAADVYRRLARFKDVPTPPPLDDVLGAVATEFHGDGDSAA